MHTLPAPTVAPLESCLDRLRRCFRDFVALDRARLLVLQVKPGDRALAEALLARALESVASTEAVLELASAFAGVAHGTVLRSELEECYPSPQPEETPEHGPHPDDVAALLHALRARLPICARGATLGVRLVPTEVAAPEAYGAWLRRLVRASPSCLRFVLVDDDDDRSLGALAVAEPDRVVVRAIDIDFAATVMALVRASDRDHPGGRVRVLLMELGQAASAGDLALAARLGAASTALALEYDLLELAAPAQLMLGGALASADAPGALRAYREAGRIGRSLAERERADAEAPGYGARLELVARLAEGSLLLERRAFAGACEAYLAATDLARALADPRLELDGLRLAALCRAELGDWARAWELSMRGLRLGLSLDDHTRDSSSLPFLGDQLLRMVARHEVLAPYGPPLEAQLVRALGASWRARLPVAG